MFFQMLASFVQSVGQMTQANAAATSANYNARIASYNATVTTQEGQIAEQQVRQQTEINQGNLRANIGASGLAGSGSAMDVVSESAYNAEMSALNTRYNYKTKATGYQMESQLDTQKANSARTGGTFAAAGILLAGSGKAYQQYSSDNSGNQPFKFG